MVLYQRNRILQVVAALAGDPKGFALDLGLDGLGAFIAKKFGDFLSIFGRDALFEGTTNFVDLARKHGLAGIKVLQRNGSLNEFVSENFQGRFCSLFGIRLNQELISRLLDLRPSVLEIEPGPNFSVGLIEGIIYLHMINFRDDIETGICCHVSPKNQK